MHAWADLDQSTAKPHNDLLNEMSLIKVELAEKAFTSSHSVEEESC